MGDDGDKRKKFKKYSIVEMLKTVRANRLLYHL